MKPDWKEAPEWANYLAMDADGCWFWHESQPHMEWGMWYSDGQMKEVTNPIDWTESLEQRP